MCLGQGSQRWGRWGEGMRAWREKTVIPASMVLCVDSRERGYQEKLEEWFVYEFLERPWEKKAAALWNWEEWERVREEFTPSLKWPSYRWHNLTSRPAELPPNIWKEQQQLWEIPSLSFGGPWGLGVIVGTAFPRLYPGFPPKGCRDFEKRTRGPAGAKASQGNACHSMTMTPTSREHPAIYKALCWCYIFSAEGIIPILYIRKQRLREAKGPIQGLSWWCHDDSWSF